MNMKTNIFIFLVTAGVDHGMAQIAPRGWKNEMKENSGTSALIRKHTAGLAFDTQVAIDMDGYYKVTAKMLDSLARVMRSEVERDYQIAITESLVRWPEADPGSNMWNEDTFHNLQTDYKNGLTAVLALKKMANRMRYKNRTINKFCFLPVRNAIDAEEHHLLNIEKRGVGSSKNMRLGIQSEVGQYALYTDVYSDFFGPVSVGVGALVGLDGRGEDDNDSFNQEVSDPAAITRLVSGGGNVVIHLTYPIASWHKPEHKMDFRMKLHPRIGIDLPTLGNSSTHYAMNLDFGIYGTLTYLGLNENIGLVAEFKLAGITGNETFFNQLAIPAREMFSLNQISLGLKLGKSFQITWVRYWGGIFKQETQPSMLAFSMGLDL